MKKLRSVSVVTGDSCLASESISRYVSGRSGQDELSQVERHLSGCLTCRREVADILKLLHPDHDLSNDLPEPSTVEIESTLSLIREVSRKERSLKERSMRRYRWVAAAAAMLFLSVAGTWVLRSYLDLRKSELFLAQAKTTLELVYNDSSPNGLRLDLPFQSAASIRSAELKETLERAENLFYQALAIHEGMVEARLGLGSVYLSRSQFSRARSEFQRVLDGAASHSEARLALGVTSYEEALQTKDPVHRVRLLREALADFDAVLASQPASAPARYNRIWVLYECGRHPEALREIDVYLAQDSRSIWAARLKDLRTRIGMGRPEDVDRTVERAAEERDAPALKSLVRADCSQIPAAIRQVLARSLAIEDASAAAGRSDASDLRWAAGIMEAEYAAVTGDRSYTRLLDFYAGLSPPQRRLKRTLDKKLQELITYHNRGKTASVIAGSRPLERAFSSFRDPWQLLNLYHLRGNSFYYRSEFSKSEADYRRMLAVADSIGSVDLVARSLASVSSALTEQCRFEEALACHRRLKELAEAHNLEYWKAFALRKIGSAYLLLNRYEESRAEYSSALSVASRQRQPELLVQILEDLGLVMENLERPGDARVLYEEAVQQLDSLRDQEASPAVLETAARRANLLFKRAGLELRTGDSTAAEALLNEALSSTTPEMRELACRTRLALAQVYLTRQEFGEAGSLVEGALETAVAGGFPELIWQGWYLKGLLLKRRGEPEPALKALEQAVSTLEQMQQKVPSGELRQSFMIARLDPYRELTSLAYDHARDELQAMTYAERAKSLALSEYLKSHELDSHFIEKTPERYADQFNRAMPPGHVGLEYFFSSDRLFVFVEDMERSRAVVAPINHAKLRDQVRRFRESIGNRDETRFSSIARDLYDELIEPVLKQVQVEDAGTLVIFPDGPLHLLPFGGLRDASGHFLLEKFALAYAPSAGVFRHCLSLNRGNAGSRLRSVLLLDGSANLRGAGDELAGLFHLYGKNARLLAAGDLDSAAEDIMTSEILHFAGHSVLVDGKPSLVLRSGGGQTVLDAKIISSWQLRRNRIANLSACNTGIGPQMDGETPWGLIPAFLNAGAPALLASLMPVDDSMTRKLNARFYELISRGSVSKARALQQAQLSILASARSRGQLSPHAWSPYVLVGDPR